MADQDTHPESIAGDSGHRTLAMAVKTESAADNDELISAVGGTEVGISPGYCSGIEWRDKDPLIEIDDENVTVHRTPAASFTPVLVSTKNKMFSPPESPRGKKPCLREGSRSTDYGHRS